MDGENKLKNDYNIVINGSPAAVPHSTVSYEEVTRIAFPVEESGVTYSVSYRNAEGRHGGSGVLVAGESVTVKKEGTSFDVTPTTRS
ncbi:MAG TPA: multiubiquitin domain-containing protein [Trebonia sp.]|nr:multiubiquitin domain-containing protein [Trebonia sp.]